MLDAECEIVGAQYSKTIIQNPASNMSLLREQRRAIGRAIVRSARSMHDVVFGKVSLPGPDQLPRRILIIRPFFLGDILLCLPVAQAIRKARPDAHIAWLLREEWRDLIEHHSVVDEVIPFSSSKMHGVQAVGEFTRVARVLRSRAFDLVINLTWDRSSIIWTRLSGAPVRIGIEEYGRPRLLSLLCTHTVVAPERSQDDRHMADFYFEPMRLMGFEVREELPKVVPSEDEAENVDLLLDSIPGKFLLIHPGGRLGSKRWPVERFEELIRKLGEKTSHALVLTCGPGEEPWVATLASSLPSGRGLFVPNPSLGELMALAKQAELFIGNDSGPMHLAAASGCRVVAIFGKDPTRWKPLGDGHCILGGAQGLAAVGVEQVVAVTMVALDRGGRFCFRS